MKKTYYQIDKGLEQVTVDFEDGHQLKFLNGVLQMDTEKFIIARGPLNGSIMLIIADYAFYHVNERAIEEYIARFDGAIRREGMILTFDNEADRVAFLLAWN
jgi:hypothetical protein